MDYLYCTEVRKRLYGNNRVKGMRWDRNLNFGDLLFLNSQDLNSLNEEKPNNSLFSVDGNHNRSITTSGLERISQVTLCMNLVDHLELTGQRLNSLYEKYIVEGVDEPVNERIHNNIVKIYKDWITFYIENFNVDLKLKEVSMKTDLSLSMALYLYISKINSIALATWKPTDEMYWMPSYSITIKPSTVSLPKPALLTIRSLDLLPKEFRNVSFSNMKIVVYSLKNVFDLLILLFQFPLEIIKTSMKCSENVEIQYYYLIEVLKLRLNLLNTRTWDDKVFLDGEERLMNFYVDLQKTSGGKIFYKSNNRLVLISSIILFALDSFKDISSYFLCGIQKSLVSLGTSIISRRRENMKNLIFKFMENVLITQATSGEKLKKFLCSTTLQTIEMSTLPFFLDWYLVRKEQMFSNGTLEGYSEFIEGGRVRDSKVLKILQNPSLILYNMCMNVFNSLSIEKKDVYINFKKFFINTVNSNRLKLNCIYDKQSLKFIKKSDMSTSLNLPSISLCNNLIIRSINLYFKSTFKFENWADVYIVDILKSYEKKPSYFNELKVKGIPFIYQSSLVEYSLFEDGNKEVLKSKDLLLVITQWILSVVNKNNGMLLWNKSVKNVTKAFKDEFNFLFDDAINVSYTNIGSSKKGDKTSNSRSKSSSYTEVNEKVPIVRRKVKKRLYENIDKNHQLIEAIENTKKRKINEEKKRSDLEGFMSIADIIQLQNKKLTEDKLLRFKGKNNPNIFKFY